MNIHCFSRQYWFRFGAGLLNFCWIGGLFLGIAIAFRMREEMTLLIPSVLSQKATLSGLMLASVLPCLLCAYGASLRELWVLPLVGGLKAFGFGFCGCSVGLVYGQCGWLLRLLLLFSDCLILAPLYLFSLRHICRRTSRVHGDIAVLLLFSVIVCIADYGVVSPFLCKLFS